MYIHGKLPCTCDSTRGITLLPASIIFGWLYENAGATTAFEFLAIRKWWVI